MTKLGVDIGGTKLLILAEDGRTWRFPTGKECGPAEIEGHVRAVMAELGGEEFAWGIAVPGLVGTDGSVVACDVLPRLEGWRPREVFPGAAVMNDVDGALVGMAAGERPDATIAVVGAGTGIAAAIQVGGVRLRTLRPFAGELGYIPCGLGGTLDERAAGAVVARNGNAREAGEYFGTGLVTLLHLVHPEKIGLYGGALRHPGYLEAALEVVERLALPAMRAGCRIEVLPDADLAVARGVLGAATRG